MKIKEKVTDKGRDTVDFCASESVCAVGRNVQRLKKAACDRAHARGRRPTSGHSHVIFSLGHGESAERERGNDQLTANPNSLHGREDQGSVYYGTAGCLGYIVGLHT